MDMLTTIKSSPKKNGVQCVFVHLGNKGLKLFRHEWDAEAAAQAQKLAHKHGIGPEVLSDVEEFETGLPHVYGFFTELAEVITQCDKKYTTDQFNELVKKMYEAFGDFDFDGYVEPFDLHNNNMGLIGDRLVCIDFGKDSFGEQSTGGYSDEYSE